MKHPSLANFLKIHTSADVEPDDLDLEMDSDLEPPLDFDDDGDDSDPDEVTQDLTYSDDNEDSSDLEDFSEHNDKSRCAYTPNTCARILTTNRKNAVMQIEAMVLSFLTQFNGSIEVPPTRSGAPAHSTPRVSLQLADRRKPRADGYAQSPKFSLKAPVNPIQSSTRLRSIMFPRVGGGTGSRSLGGPLL